MPETLTLGYSPCPNDCFIFYALVHGKVSSPVDWQVHLEDVETLNQWGSQARLDISKISYHAYAHMLEDYIMLPAGGALGHGVGPLLVSRGSSLHPGDTIAIPGGLTTANLLLKLWQPEQVHTKVYRYDAIMPALQRGEVAAGLIIHESRFTYQHYGLHMLLDLGTWWQEYSGLPIPLGGIMIRRNSDPQLMHAINQALRASITYAYAQPAQVHPYLAAHAQEMAPEVMQQHVALYVNDYSLDVGAQGRAAVATLFERARAKGLVPASPLPLFADLPS